MRALSLPGEPPFSAVRAATGRIDATLAACDGRTELRQAFCSSPLKIAKAFPQPDGSAEICTMDCSPGLLEGDCYDTQWRLLPGARAVITSQSFTKAHPCPTGTCGQRTQLYIADGAWLRYEPQPLLLYREAAYRGECTVDIEAGGTLLMADIIGAGRIGHGEEFKFREYRNRVHVRYDGELIYCTQTRFAPAEGNCRTGVALGDYTHWGSFTVISPHVDGSLTEQLHGVLNEHDAVSGGVSTMERNGAIVSFVGRNAQELQHLCGLLTRSASAALRMVNAVSEPPASLRY